MLLGTLGASLLENLLTGKGAKQRVKDKVQLEQVKAQLGLVRIFNTGLSFN